MPAMSSDTTRRGCGIVTISGTGIHASDHDESGMMVRDALLAAGQTVVHQRWISDDLTNIRYLFREWVDDPRVEVIIAIGGTGLASTDVTPEALAPLITKHMPGFGELFRSLSFHAQGVSALETRAMAAVCYATLVYLIPGAPQAVGLAMRKLILPQLEERVINSDRLRPTMLPSIRVPPNRPE